MLFRDFRSRNKGERLYTFFISGKEEELEAVDKPEQTNCQVGIEVSNFEEACNYLEKRGIALEKPKFNKNRRVVFLRNPDPVGKSLFVP